MKGKMPSHCFFIMLIIFLNISLQWAMTVSLARDGRRNHSELHTQVDAIEFLQQDQDKGKRNTYCDYLRHLVEFHAVDSDILIECVDTEYTDIQNTMIMEGI